MKTCVGAVFLYESIRHACLLVFPVLPPPHWIKRTSSFQFYAWWFNYPGGLIHTKLGVARLIVFEGGWVKHD